jgi:HD-like signal output (HDOD) protein
MLSRVRQLATSAARAAAEVRSQTNRVEDKIYLDFHEAIRTGNVELPGMPEVAVRIVRHIDSPVSTTDSIARIVQMDPSVTARLVRVSNSPAFGGLTRVETAHDAITRLGRNATRNLVTSFVLKAVFRARSPLVKQQMHALWQHSTHVAALCHALAKRSPGFDPAQALLIGLVHDIGVIPILTGAHRYQGMAENKQLLERVVRRLRADFSALTLRKWNFAAEFVEAAQDAEEWFRDKRPQVDYADLLLVAQLHSFVGTPHMADLPRIDAIPAFRKLALGELSPRTSLRVLDAAKKEIDEVKRLIA